MSVGGVRFAYLTYRYLSQGTHQMNLNETRRLDDDEDTVGV